MKARQKKWSTSHEPQLRTVPKEWKILGGEIAAANSRFLNGVAGSEHGIALAAHAGVEFIINVTLIST